MQMLRSLVISNFALIEYACIEFSEQLNIITGETGAGKSIFMEALGVALGERASADLIRSGCDALRVEAVFDIGQQAPICSLLQEMAIDLEEDGSLLITRRISRHGKNTIQLNGFQIPLAQLRQLSEYLLDMHGQHENQALLRQNTYLPLIDSLLPSQDVLQQYQKNYQQWHQLGQELSDLLQQSRDREQRLDILKWQTQEIGAAQLLANEDEALDEEMLKVANVEKIVNSSQKAYSIMQDGEKGGVLGLLSEVRRELETVTRYDRQLASCHQGITEVFFLLEEHCHELRSYCEDVEFDPSRLAEIQDRLDLIHKLKRKYGNSIEEIQEFYANALRELESLANQDERIAALQEKSEELAKELSLLASKLHLQREKASQGLVAGIKRHLADLGLPHALFEVNFENKATLGPQGTDDVSLLFTANPGEAAKPLHKIASGGELSRIALAIKSMAGVTDAPCMVFDEIDTGIGGKTAQMVSDKILNLSRNKQILCITHLPQIASAADRHIYIEKQQSATQTLSIIRILSAEEQVVELARMSSGHADTSSVLQHARQMLASAAAKK
ncbi:DNA repair protein RecN [Azotosporobacter soli]|uniref:DNA repair protein RecN n=1 Tax=Azotosporobacter soli TaxID=3055040 RepID=UPI0031FECED6